MRIIGTKTRARFRLIIICIFSLLSIAFAANCRATRGEKTPPHSKDYREFPADSPEAVLTAFIESDLGAIFNRQDDDRYPLWWNLTELSGVPEENQNLVIDSYKISRKSGNNQSGEVILNLALKVKAIWLCGNPRNKNLGWRDLTVYIGSVRHSLASTKLLFDDVYGGDNTIISQIQKNIHGYYKVPTMKQQWVFPVKMALINNKWRISADTIPIQSSYTTSHINWYRDLIHNRLIFDDVCNGEGKISSSITNQYAYGEYERIGKNYNKFKLRFCTEDEKIFRRKLVNRYLEIIKNLTGEE